MEVAVYFKLKRRTKKYCRQNLLGFEKKKKGKYIYIIVHYKLIFFF